MNKKLTELLGLTVGLAALALAAAACGGGGHHNIIIDPPLRTAQSTSTPHSSNSGSLTGKSLVDALANGGFPGVHLSVSHSVGSTSVMNGPELSDQQLNAGVISEVNVDLGGTDSRNSVAYDVFSTDNEAARWSSSFSLGMYGGYRVDGTSSATVAGKHAKCEQFADVGGGRNAGGTQCFAQVGSVVVYGESIIFDTQAGSPADAQAMLKAGIEHLAAVEGQG